MPGNTPFHWDLTLNPEQFMNALQSAAQSVQGSASQMQSQLTAAFTRIQSIVVGVGAVLAGGSVFAASIDKSRALTKEAELLGRQFGISATEAGVLAMALSEIDQTTEPLQAASKALVTTLRDDEDTINALGVATRDANGSFRNQLDIMLDVNKRLLDFTEGTQRNVEGSKVYRKAWQEVEPILRLNTDLMEESRKRAEALGLVVGEENVEQMHRYNAAMNSVNDVMTATKKAVADAVMPVLTDLGNWFAESGPQRVEVMRKAMAVIVSAFYGLKMVVEIVWGTLKAGVQQITVYLLTIAEVAERAMAFDFSGAKEAWNRGMQQVADIGDQWMDQIVRDAESNRDKIFAALYKGFEGPGVTPIKRKPGGDDEADTQKITMQMLEAELGARRSQIEQKALLEGSFRQMSKAEEAAFWQEKLSAYASNEQLAAGISKKYYDAEREARKQAFESEMQGLKNQIEEQKKSASARIDLANQVYVQTVQRFGMMSKEAQAALGELQRVYREYFEEQRKLQQMAADAERDYHLSGVALARVNLDTQAQLGQINAKQRLAALRELSDAEYQIRLAAAEHEAELYVDDEVAYREHVNKIAALKEQHAVDLATIDGQIQVEQFRVWREIGDAITGAFSTAIKGVIMGTQTLTQAMRNMAQSVLLALLDMGARLVAQQILNAIIGKSIDKAAKVGEINNAAALAAANAYASTAAIPVVGPELAPEAAAVAFAAANSWQGALLAAAKGFDVPAGMNPLTQLHAKEMVLPADLAEGVRDMVAGGGGGQPVHFHVHALDARSVRDYFRANANALQPAVRDLARRFAG
jgi:hypothetical protein